MCEHKIKTKVENGLIISYCEKCGKILDTTPVNTNSDIDKAPVREEKFNVNEWNGFNGGSGDILHG